VNFGLEVELFSYDHMVADVGDATISDERMAAFGRWFEYIERSEIRNEILNSLLDSEPTQLLIQDLKNRESNHVDSVVYSLTKFPDDMGVYFIALNRIIDNDLFYPAEGKIKRFSKKNLPYGTLHLINEIFRPLAAAVKDLIISISESGNITRPYTVPASDRVVPLNHNQPEVVEFSQEIAELERRINRLNDFGHTPEEGRIKAQLVAANRLFEPSELQLEPFNTLIRSVLSYLQKAARFTLDKVLGGLIVQAIAHWDKIYAMLRHFQ